jgi:O-acetyl-ADP-ribose deacetylase (regulator of RNase III)
MTISKALFYKSSVPPKLIHSLVAVGKDGAAAATDKKQTRRSRFRRRIEIWTTTCIVTNFGKTTNANCSILINPSNAELSGVSNFTYFPRGGPVPDKVKFSSSGSSNSSGMHRDWQPLGYVSNWGGMEVGNGMLYPVSVVDGLVHQLGGWKLAAACRWNQQQSTFRSMLRTQQQQQSTSNSSNGKNAACPIGTAVYTTLACSELLEQYNAIIHTTPPFYLHDENPIQQLDSCYQSALRLAATIPVHSKNNNSHHDASAELRVATPLLGAGARGFPMDVAIQVAAKASWRWLQGESNDTELDANVDSGNVTSSTNKVSETRKMTLVFGLLEPSWANDMMEAYTRLQQEPNGHGPQY